MDLNQEQNAVDYASSLVTKLVPGWKSQHAFRMMKLKCLCGYHPKIDYSENVKPGEMYFYCGVQGNPVCKYFLWYRSVYHDHEKLCHCGQPTIRVPNPDLPQCHGGFYICSRRKFGCGCDYSQA